MSRVIAFIMLTDEDIMLYKFFVLIGVISCLLWAIFD